MLTLQTTARRVYLAILVQFLFIVWFMHHTFHPRGAPPPLPAIDTTQNSTLGFGAILYISVPSRTDRQDAIHLAASHTNLTLSMIPGVSGTDIHAKARPANTKVTASELGCWRAHANAWRAVLDSGAETGLILEDDADWDVDIRIAARALSRRMCSNPLRVDGRQGGGVYGDDWDVLWVSSCLHGRHPKFQWVHSEYADASAPGSGEVTNHVKKLWAGHGGGEYPKRGGKRLLAPAYQPICTLGYAVSRRGAQKLLLAVGYKGLKGPVDIAMMAAHQKGELWGYVVQPGWFWQWKVGGGRDSDIQKYSGGAEKGYHQGKSNNIRNSARNAMQKEWDTSGAWEKVESVYNRDKSVAGLRKSEQ